VWLASLALALPLAPRVAFGLAFLAVTAEIVVVAARTPRLGGLGLAVGLAAAALGVLSLAGRPPTPFNAAALTAGLLAGGSLLGTFLGARVERPGHLLAVAAISGVADLWSVFDAGGPTAKLVEKALAAPEQIALFALPWPLLGSGQIAPIIGVGDVVFAGLYLGCFARHGLSTRRAALGLTCGFVAGLVALLVLERPIPLLPLLGAGVVLADRAARDLETRELRMVTTVVLALLAILGARLWG
jgi:hypothetical protein